VQDHAARAAGGGILFQCKSMPHGLFEKLSDVPVNFLFCPFFWNETQASSKVTLQKFSIFFKKHYFIVTVNYLSQLLPKKTEKKKKRSGNNNSGVFFCGRHVGGIFFLEFEQIVFFCFFFAKDTWGWCLCRELEGSKN
jgi:hypothetical protein